MSITIYHNPRCSKSRATLALLRERGHQPQVIEYLRDPPDADTIHRLLALLGISAHELIRTGEAAYREAALSPDLPENQLIAALQQHPILLQRPIVEANGRAAIGRPPETVLEIL
ncbi:MAG: arsenate reductase (glutaredoxin) [Gammaproteobacteria bacterium]|jgi:arsenate reductase|nr:arsenate reductase (glutaredoxin) [Gammaproteobacteria bacterium]